MGLEHAAATLYWQAFRAKLGKLLGPESRAIKFFAETINHAAMLAAFENDALVGIAAFQNGPDGFSAAGVGDLFRHYGLGAVWRIIPLALLDRRGAAGVLQMDGICVRADMRGCGVGTKLLRALFDHARANGYHGITLDVIDTNPRARALYETLGFKTTKVWQTTVMRPLLGFTTATKMTKMLD